MRNQSMMWSWVAVLGSLSLCACTFDEVGSDDGVPLAGTTGTTGEATTEPVTATETGEPETTGGAELVELDISVCAPENGPFTTEIDNPYFPLVVGNQLVLEGEDDEGTMVRVEITVLDETRDVAGVTTRVVTETEFEDDELVEISRNFFVQAPDGTVCYYGEEVEDYEDGMIVGSEGEWLAGGVNQPGIIMPGMPEVNTMFAQEVAPDIAEDMSAIVALDETATVPFGTFDNVLHAIDWNPLEGETFEDGEDKLYAPGIGIIQDDVVFLVDVVSPM